MIEINKRETVITFDFTDDYTIRGNVKFNDVNKIVDMNLSIYNNDNSYVGNANVYTSSQTDDLQINVANVPTNVITNVAASINSCINEITTKYSNILDK